MTERKPNDGRPYYCDLCGLGFGEYLACDFLDCKLEPEADALKRASKSVLRRIEAQKRAPAAKLAPWAERLLRER